MPRKSGSLVDIAIQRAEVATGRRNLGASSVGALAGVTAIPVKQQMPAWTADEDQFLREHLGYVSEQEIADKLGRTIYAVHLRWERDLHLPAPSKNPDIITALKASEMLGIDGHKITHWVDMGLIPGRLMPGTRKIRLIPRVSLMRWALSPDNWVWFDIHKVPDPKLKRLLHLRAKRWGDEWWSTPQVAHYHGVTTKDVLRYIKLGYLQAYRLPVSLGGRDENRYWSYWRIRKSHALAVEFRNHVKDSSKVFTPLADAFLVKAKDEWGLTFNAIGRMMKIGQALEPGSNKTIAYRYWRLKKMMKVQKGKRK